MIVHPHRACTTEAVLMTSTRTHALVTERTRERTVKRKLMNVKVICVHTESVLTGWDSTNVNVLKVILAASVTA